MDVYRLPERADPDIFWKISVGDSQEGIQVCVAAARSRRECPADWSGRVMGFLSSIESVGSAIAGWAEDTWQSRGKGNALQHGFDNTVSQATATGAKFRDWITTDMGKQNSIYRSAAAPRAINPPEPFETWRMIKSGRG